MSKQGQDCYFFFYSSCAKGDSCAFRHCEAAIGNETVCTLWQEGRCFRQVCKFRHMEIDKKRSEIPCYWENQLTGCQKANCAFHHTKGRYVDGVFLPPSKTAVNWAEHVEDGVNTTPSAPPRSKRSTMPNTSPQLRGIIKVDNENVPSPTHPPVVINAADDDDDDGGRLNIGLRSLHQTNSKNLNERGSLAASGEEPCIPLTLAERLEKCRTPFTEYPSGDDVGPLLKRSLAERLGRKIKGPEMCENEALQTVYVPKSIKERLGFSSEQSSIEKENPTQPAKEIRIKTLEEIRLEKLSQKLEQDQHLKGDGALGTEDPNTNAQSGIRIKSFMEVLAEKKLRQMEEAEKQRVDSESSEPVKSGDEPQIMSTQIKLRGGNGKVQLVEASGKRRAMERVRVKTLEEIKLEKALRQRMGGESSTNKVSQAEPITTARRRLATAKPAAEKEEKLQAELSVPAVPWTSAGGDAHQTCLDLRESDSNARVLVKSFEEIMRDKRQRKQQEAAVQLLKEHTPLLILDSIVETEAPTENSHTVEVPVPTATKEPTSASKLLQVKPHFSTSGISPNLSPGKQHVSASLRSSEISPVRPQQPARVKSQQSRLQGSSPVRPQPPSSPVRPQPPSSPVRPQQPSSPVRPQESSSPVKLQQPSSPVKPQQPTSPMRAQQLLLPVKSQQALSPVKPQLPSPAKPQQLSLPVKPLQPSSPARPLQMSLPVRPQQPSSPVKAQPPSSPVKSTEPSSPVKAQQPLPVQPQQQASPVKPQQLSSSVQPQQLFQVKIQQLPQVVPMELSPVAQQEALEKTSQETTDSLSPEDEGSTGADVTAGQAVRKVKGKPRASVKPSVGRKRAPAKGPQKRKGAKSKPTAVAAVKPLSPSTTATDGEPPSKKAALVTIDSSLAEEVQSTRAHLEISKDRVSSPEVQHTVPTAEMGSPVSSPASVKTRRSSASAPKTPQPAEDDFESLMWELSEGRLEEEAEIDLDAGKDEDDLLLELSEMIDS